MKTRYVVQGEHTLGYVYDVQPDVLHFLHCSVLRGSPYNPMSGFTMITADMTIRDATPQDFLEYRVCAPPGWTGNVK